jgi:type IV pilus assembly protein PilA
MEAPAGQTSVFETGRGENEMRKQKGFSLIELLIVVAIILIIAAIAIPNLLRARIAANESSAVSSVRTINTAQVTYQSSYPTVGFASTIAALGPSASTGCTTPASTNACLVDWVVSQASTAGNAKSGYYFGDTPSAALNGIVPGYTVDGIPASVNQTGVRGFCSNEDAVIRFTAVGSAMSAGTAACAAYTALQ